MKRSKTYSEDSQRAGANKALDSMFFGDVKAARSAYRHNGHINNEVRSSVSYLSAVTVSVDYSDYLKHCLEANHKYFDEWVVVTSTDDKQTIDLCKKYDSVTLVTTDCFYEDEAKFNKGCAVNIGLDAISKQGWVLIIDSDIVLCPGFRDKLNSHQLSVATLYGTPRYFVKTEEEYLKYKNMESPSMTVFKKRQIFRKAPIGYFQLFHSVNLQLPIFRDLKPYPDNHPDATHSDMVFMNKFKSKSSLRAVPCIHLGEDGKNWYGRVTPVFNSKQTPIKYPVSQYKKELESCLDNPVRDLKDNSEFQKFLKDTKVYVSLTTSPLRIDKISYPLNTLDFEIVEKVILSIPENFRGTDPYVIPDYILKDPKILIYRDFEDVGPLSKLTPALSLLKESDPNSILITIDDDTIYPYGMCTEIVYAMYTNSNTVVTASAPELDFWGISSTDFTFNFSRVSEGFAGVGYRVSDVPRKAIAEMIEISESCPSCKYSDDIVHSFVLSKYNVGVKILNNMYYGIKNVRQLKYGFRDDAMFKASGLPEFKEILDSDDVRPDGVNMHKYKDCVARLKI